MTDGPSNTGSDSELASSGFPGAEAASTESPSLHADATTLIASTAAGLIGASIVITLSDVSAIHWTVGGAVFGAFLGLVASSKVATPGQGIVQGLGLGVLAWVLALVMLSIQRNSVMMALPSTFPLFVRTTLGLGAPVGLTVGTVRAVDWPSDSLRKSVIGGAVAGVGASVLFSIAIGPAGTVQSLTAVAMIPTPLVASVVHYFVAGVIGITFGVMFEREARSLGSALTYGLGYGLFWWLLGSLTLLPLLRTGSVAWSTELAHPKLANLIGHAVYGTLLGLLYAILNGLWRGLFYDPDPVHPGTGTISVRSVGASARGAVASIIGGLSFGIVLEETGRLSVVASLIGRSDPFVGFFLHMSVAAVIGATYGQLFEYEAPDFGAGVIWGTVYGVVWWVFGALTLLPLLTGNPVTWNPRTIEAALPMLIGHILYGALTGATFTALERRKAAWATVDSQTNRRERLHRRPFGTVAASLWLFILATVVVVPSTLI